VLLEFQIGVVIRGLSNIKSVESVKVKSVIKEANFLIRFHKPTEVEVVMEVALNID
jgi:hypothetical protein